MLMNLFIDMILEIRNGRVKDKERVKNQTLYTSRWIYNNVAENVINEYSLSFDFVLLLRSHSTTEELVGAVAS